MAKLPVLLFGVISTEDNPDPRCAALIDDTVVELSKLWRLRYAVTKESSWDIDIAVIFQCVSNPGFMHLIHQSYLTTEWVRLGFLESIRRAAVEH